LLPSGRCASPPAQAEEQAWDTDAPEESVMTSQWDAQMEAFGAFVRSQRKLANLTLRQLAELTSLSNPYLSELERGMHQPSVRVLKQLSDALNVSAEMLLTQAGLIDRRTAAEAPDDSSGVDHAIRTDATLDDAQKAALLAVYQSMTRPQQAAD
jgi:transcriptional regulator with XRE-family HTH domain